MGAVRKSKWNQRRFLHVLFDYAIGETQGGDKGILRSILALSLS